MALWINDRGVSLRTRLSHLADRARSSYWLVPSLMSGGAVLLSYALVAVDDAWPGPISRHLGWVVKGGPEAARAFLATIAGSVITIAGIASSILIVALSLASQQLGPRVLMSFRSDRGIQVTLGTFVATFIYCVLVMRRVGAADGLHPVPHVAVLGALVIGLASLGVLIYFIHHAAASIQSDHVIAAIGRDLDGTIDRLAPPETDAETPAPAAAPEPVGSEAGARDVCATKYGYVQAIDESRLVALASRYGLVVRMVTGAGDYIVPGLVIARVSPIDRGDPDVEDAIRGAMVLGSTRTHEQDVVFAFEQLVEVAVRALSPGINDPFTAVRVVDRLSEGLNRLFRCYGPSAGRCDREGQLRLVKPRIPAEEVISAALGPIRVYALHHPMVLIRVLRAIGRLGPSAGDEERAALTQQARLVLHDARRVVPNPSDLRLIESAYRTALGALTRW